MSQRGATRLLLVAMLCGVPGMAGADVAASAPDGQRIGALPSAVLPAAQLEDLVAPIALYPDALLSQVLVASTYPLEVVEARQWLRRNRGLEGAALTEEAKKQRWDASVQSLVAFPDVLDLLTEDVEWTSSLGDAFLAQEADVMAAVQRLRSRARASGKLVSTAEQRVTEEAQEGRTIVQIVPATTEVVYVPTYDPWYVWGAPAWSAYPPLYYAPGYAFAAGVDVGLWFGGWTWGWGWGWYPNWHGGTVWVNGSWFSHCGYRYAHYDHHGGGYHGGYGPGHGGGGHGGGHGAPGPHGGPGERMAWSHDPGHRQGVPYSSGRNVSRYGAASRASRSASIGNGWRSGRETGAYSGGRASAFGSRGSSEAWRNPGGATRGWGSSPQERTSARGSASEAWRNPGATHRSDDSAWRNPGSSRGSDWTGRNPSSYRSADSAWRERGASPRTLGASPRYSETSPRSLGSSPRSWSSSGWSSPRGSSPEGYRAAPRGGAEGGRGWSSGGGRSWSGTASPRSSSGSFGSGGASRGSSGGYTGGSRGGGGGSQGGGHRGGGGRH